MNKDFNNNCDDVAAKAKRFKCVFLANTPSNNQICNLQINRKVIDYGYKPGCVLEITPIIPASHTSFTNAVNSPNLNTSLNTSFSFNNNSSLTQTSEDVHTCPLLLQITKESLRDDVALDTIRIDQAACMEPFNFTNYSYVNVRLVPLEQIQLDLVELIFKEQYFNGSDMWRMKKHIQDTCVYIKKNIEFSAMRCSIREMWMNGEIVTCGYITEQTRLVFRSQSAMCTIYIQMSSEMWEFDANGEMYHEKAINFLAELFSNWKNQTCTHDVTIALFSRVFYETSNINDFPPQLTTCIQKDHKNRFYEDFYRVVYQNERYDDWAFSLIKLKHLIKEYRDYILNYHERHTQYSQSVPKCYLSNAAEGNFLETLNLSSSVFERSFIDRPFDRTGMMSLVITGGRGVFEVKRELSKITKGRVIDNGIGSDLVCLGEQPLHQVPLFKLAGSDIFSIPYWINLSFYKSSEVIRFCNSKFQPRIKIKFNTVCDNRLDPSSILPGYEPSINNSLEESDDILLNPKHDDKYQKQLFLRSISKSVKTASSYEDLDDDFLIALESDPETVNNQNFNVKQKSINPFSPSSICPRMSFDRRRWAHLFPLRPDGTPIFQHWIRINSLTSSASPGLLANFDVTSKASYDDFSISFDKSSYHNKNDSSSLQDRIAADKVIDKFRCVHFNDNENDDCIATMIAGVAWKSLTIPACLPLTTDYMSDQDNYQLNFNNIKSYKLVLDKIREENKFTGLPIEMRNILPELIGHRIALGFQLVQFKGDKKVQSNSFIEKYVLCTSHMYHEIDYLIDEETGNDYVKVEIFNAKKDLKRVYEEYSYTYRFQVPDSKLYHISYCDFTRKNSKQINWEAIDRYICVQGNGSVISPLELQNCWRQRLYMLPLMYINANASSQQNLATVVLTQSTNALTTTRFDVYHRKTVEELTDYRENYFIRFMEFLNKVTRVDENWRILYNAPKVKANILPSPKDQLEKLLSLNDSNKNSEIKAYLEATYQKAMVAGIPILTKKPDIPPNCFISAEATWWCIQNIKDIDTEEQAIELLQTMLDYGVIQHISKYEKTFIHGFYFYYILTKENFNVKFEYTKDYCEVGLCEFERGVKLDEKNIFERIHKKDELLPASCTDYSHAQYGLNLAIESPILKIVNVDVDPQKRSTRVEWASALYRSYYHPLCAFELEIYWKMATGQLLADLINNWAKKSVKFNYHIVPGPIDPFVTPLEELADPLRGYIYISLNTKVLVQNENILFSDFIERKYFDCDEKDPNLLRIKSIEAVINDQEFMEFLRNKYQEGFEAFVNLNDPNRLIEREFQDFLEYKRIIHLKYFQEAILERFGFVRNAAIAKQANSDDDQPFFIHSSGGMFVMIPNYFASLNGRTRHPSAANQQLVQQAHLSRLSKVDESNNRANNTINENKNVHLTNRNLKRAKSTSRLHTKFYELNRGTIKLSSSKIAAAFNQQQQQQQKGVLRLPQRQISHEPLRVLIDENDDNRKTKSYNHKQKIMIDDTLTVEKKTPFYINNTLFIGFLWSWNFMLGKRWRSSFTGDEAFQDNALADFRLFCSNKENRLRSFYKNIKSKDCY